MLSLKAAPIRWFLGMAGAGTNKAEGVRLLKLTADQGHYLAPFARLMLAVGELRDGRTQQGKEILIGLSREFPQKHPLPAPDRSPPLTIAPRVSEIQH